jgi:hypothetical protein
MTVSHLAELHDDVLGGVGAEDELEILDGGQLHAAPEVEAPATQPLVPMRRLVAQLHALPPIPLLHIHALELRRCSIKPGHLYATRLLPDKLRTETG